MLDQHSKTNVESAWISFTMERHMYGGLFYVPVTLTKQTPVYNVKESYCNLLLTYYQLTVQNEYQIFKIKKNISTRREQPCFLRLRQRRDVKRSQGDATCREKGRAFRGLFLFISLFHVHKTTTMVDN